MLRDCKGSVVNRATYKINNRVKVRLFFRVNQIPLIKV